MSAHAEQCARDLPRRGRACPAQSGPSAEARRSSKHRPYKSDVLQWQEEALIELVDDGGDLGGLRVMRDCEFNI